VTNLEGRNWGRQLASLWPGGRDGQGEQSLPGRAGTDRLQVLDSLRGLAALAVCLFHFAGRDGFLPDSPFKTCSRHGDLGVIVFFVISGFVIPWSLHRAGYRLCEFGRFVFKRLLRLEPPYLVAVASVVAFAAVYCRVKGQPFPPDPHWWTRAALHAGYLTRFFGYNWLDDIYWTLAIEFQFYLLLGLVFPLLSHRCAALRRAICVAIALIGFSAVALPIKMFVITMLPVFVLGILTYQFRTGLVRRTEYVAGVLLAGLVCCCTSGWVISLTALLTAVAIAGGSGGWGVLNALGAISYSLYLFHPTLGGAIINLGIKHTTSPGARYAVFLAALGASFAAATLVYWLVERPAQRWSSTIRYASARSEPERAPASAVPRLPLATTPASSE
jgi:peptidoglycan/LPS O-acetylase OafA/YrhL